MRKTAHQVSVPGGHSYTAYDYEIKPVPETVQAICYVTEKGAMRFEYLPVGKYVLVEEQAPDGYTVADPVYVPVLDVGSKERIQGFTMVDEPIQVLLSKVNTAGGKELAGEMCIRDSNVSFRTVDSTVVHVEHVSLNPVSYTHLARILIW